jgi:Uma2 family endonuclease
MSNLAASLGTRYADYARDEEGSAVKHEWLEGVLFAMSGGTPEHGALAVAVLSILKRELTGKPCRPFSSDVRVRIQATGLGTYPDGMVVCGKLEVDPEDPNSVVNPKALIEVLSHSTESYDRGKKFAHYKQIPSLEHYILVSSDRRYIEWFTRAPHEAGNGNELWHYRAAEDGGQVALTALECTLLVDEVYFNPLAP